MEINGIAHVILTTSDFAASRDFYAKLLPFFGLQVVIDAPEYFYCVGGRTALGIKPCTEEYRGQRFAQGRSGLHHVCFRARSREAVDEVHALLVTMGTTIVHPPQDEPWAPGYYSVLFEDPDGVRLEVNFVPGKGLLQPTT